MGIVVSEEDVKKTVASVLEANEDLIKNKGWNAVGVIMKVCSVPIFFFILTLLQETTQRLEWADGQLVKNLVHSALEEKCGPQKAERKAAKEPKEQQGEAKKKDDVVVKPDTPFEFIRVHEASQHLEKRVLVKGWVHEARFQGKMMFLVVRDAGSGFIQ